MITIYTDSTRFFRKCNGLPDGRVVSMTKNEYGSAAQFLKAYFIHQSQYQSQYQMND